jgi:hypothetical protein
MRGEGRGGIEKKGRGKDERERVRHGNCTGRLLLYSP